MQGNWQNFEMKLQTDMARLQKTRLLRHGALSENRTVLIPLYLERVILTFRSKARRTIAGENGAGQQIQTNAFKRL